MRGQLWLATTNPGVRAAIEPWEGERSALGLALRAYLAACALHPAVLLSSVSLLLAGFGARRAIDGRARQPGLGVGRPRGALPGEPIPDAARVAAPMTLPALFVAWGYGPEGGLATRLLQAATLARRRGGEARAALLERAAELGAGALRGSELERELLARAAPAQGGLLTVEDLEPARELDHAVEGDTVLELPWNEAGSSAGAEAILALDTQGGAVAICYEAPEEGLALFGGELRCPLVAAPVLRGVPRLKPGRPLPQACDARVELDPETKLLRAVAARGLRLELPFRN